MADHRNEDDRWNDWEQQAIAEAECSADAYEQRILIEEDVINQRIWTIFQNAAQCVALMYKGAADNQQHTLWGPFQTAASCITALYKESLDALRKSKESGMQSGTYKQKREIINWARRKRNIRKDELLSLLSGKPLPYRSTNMRGSPRQRIVLERALASSVSNSHSAYNTHGPDDNMSTFKEALGGACLTSNQFSPKRRELETFISSEIARHKRPASPNHDVAMDSPQHKRFKYT